MSTYSKTALRVLLTSVAALAALVLFAGPASAGVGQCYAVLTTTNAGTANFNDNPAGGWPGDSMRACDDKADGWGVKATLDIGRNGSIDRTASTWGHNSPYCTPWKTGNIAEGTKSYLKVCNVKPGQDNCYCRTITVIA